MLEIIIINNTENLPRPILSISVGFSLAAERIFPLFFCFWTMCVNPSSCCRLFNVYSAFL